MMVGWRARKQLREWMAADPDRRTQSAIAAALGVSQPAVCQWTEGPGRPGEIRALALEKLSDGAVVALDWLSAIERAEREALDNVEPMVSPTGSEG